MQFKAYKIKSEMHTQSKGHYQARRRVGSSSVNPMEAANNSVHRTGDKRVSALRAQYRWRQPVTLGVGPSKRLHPRKSVRSDFSG
jgi:hypothetical protein